MHVSATLAQSAIGDL